MRTIRFRGKRVDNGEWIFGDLANYFGDDPCIMPKSFFATRDFGEVEKNGLPKFEDSMALGGFYLVIPETVGQFTGLTDKNGKEIFEGDFVKVPDDFEKFGFMAGEIRSVYFIGGCFRLKPPKDTGGLGHTLEDSMDECEVIGNIHDKIELINDKK